MGDSAYARAGVDTGRAGRGVAALVDVLRTIDTGRASRAVLGSGHYANVLRLAGETGLALSTDGVGTKLIVAEQLGRYDTVGIDCIAMNVNDVICVGAEPIAVLDYVAVEEADSMRARGDRRGAQGGRRGRRGRDPGRRAGGGTRADPGASVPRRDRPGGDVRRAGRDPAHRDRRGSAAPATPSSGCPPAACTPTASRSPARRFPTWPSGLPSSAASRSATRCSSRP